MPGILLCHVTSGMTHVIKLHPSFLSSPTHPGIRWKLEMFLGQAMAQDGGNEHTWSGRQEKSVHFFKWNIVYVSGTTTMEHSSRWHHPHGVQLLSELPVLMSMYTHVCIYTWSHDYQFYVHIWNNQTYRSVWVDIQLYIECMVCYVSFVPWSRTTQRP